MHIQTFNLPQPPSANRYWRKTRNGQIYISEQGKNYRKAIGTHLMVAGYKPLEDARIGMETVYFPPTRGGLDLDNLNKALWDALEAARLFNNDKQIDYHLQQRGPRFQAGMVRIRIWPDPKPCPELP